MSSWWRIKWAGSDVVFRRWIVHLWWNKHQSTPQSVIHAVCFTCRQQIRVQPAIKSLSSLVKPTLCFFIWYHRRASVYFCPLVCYLRWMYRQVLVLAVFAACLCGFPASCARNLNYRPIIGKNHIFLCYFTVLVMVKQCMVCVVDDVLRIEASLQMLEHSRVGFSLIF